MECQSHYNILVDNNDGSALFFNARTGALIRLSPQRRKQIYKTREITEDFKNFLIQQGFLIDNGIDEIKLIADAHEMARNDDRLFAATVELTEACNFRCLYCYQDHVPKHMSDQTAEKVILYLVQKMERFGHLHINWFGGEPLLRIETMTMMSQRLSEEAQSHGCAFSQFLTTNGYLLTPKVADKLVELGVRQVQITLDGDEYSHNRLRILKSGKGTFKEVLNSCKNVVTAGMELMVRVNVNRWNVHGINSMLSDLVSQSISPANTVIHAVRAIDHGNCSNGISSIMFTNPQFAKEWIMILQLIIKYGFGLPTLEPRAYNCTFDLKQTVMIGRDGTIRHCTSSDGRLADLTETGEEINFTPLFDVIKIRKPLDDPDCKECKCLPLCMGGCSYLQEIAQEKCNPERYVLPELVRLTAFQNNVIKGDKCIGEKTSKITL